MEPENLGCDKCKIAVAFVTDWKKYVTRFVKRAAATILCSPALRGEKQPHFSNEFQKTLQKNCCYFIVGMFYCILCTNTGHYGTPCRQIAMSHTLLVLYISITVQCTLNQ